MYNKWLRQLPTYSMVTWDKWDYSCLNESPVIHRQSNIDHLLYSRLIITADTETSKGVNTDHNHIVVWSVSVAYKDTKIVTLYGRKPSDLSRCLQKLKDSIPCNRMYVFWHNLAYDWVFIRKFILTAYDKPEYQLNIKPHYPLLIEFMNGIIFRDSLAIGQRRLGKWAEDLKCEHAKTDEWDYKAVRHQNTSLSAEELHYLEMDTLVLTECINKTMDLLKCTIVTLPYTATGIPRRDIRKIGKKHKAKVKYNNCLMTYEDYIMAERTYHGGYSHANRFYIGQLMKGNIACYDFSSSYPAVLIQEKYPIEKFSPIDEISAAEILELSDKYAFMFNLELVMPALKQAEPMPALQLSKAEKVINPVLDNGRVLNAAYVSVPVTEQDLAVIVEQYDFMDINIKDCRVAVKDYLPRWLTDYIYNLYEDKCTLKGGDPVIYDVQKSKLNSVYG